MNIDVLTPEGATAGTVELPADLFDVQVNVPLIHQVVVAQLAAARQGTADTKTRAEVSGGGRKPYKQKGTGRARQGSIRAPQFTGGGVVHGPTPRDYAQRTPKKMKAAALRGALSDRARNGRVHVISSIVAGEVPSAKSAAAALATISDRPNLLVVVSREDIIGWKSLRNLNNVHLIVVDQLNTYDVLCSDDVVFTADALETFVETRSSGVSAPAASPVAKVRAAVKAATAKVVEEVAEEVEEVAEKVESLAHRVEKKAEEVASRAAKVGDAKEPVAQAPAPKVEAPAAKPEVEAEAEAEAEPVKAETAEAEPAEVATPEVATANVTTAAVATPEVETPEVEAPKVAAPKVVAPKATETDEEVDQ